MTKILFLIPTLMHGGAEKVLVNLVNNLDKKKYEVTLYSIFDDGVNKSFLNNEVIYCSKFKKVFRGNSQLMKLFSPKRLYRFFIKEEYDIVVSYLEGPAARIISGCPNPKTKKVAWIHSSFKDENTAVTGFRNLKEATNNYSKFDRIIGVSDGVLRCFQQWFNKNNGLVLYNTLDTDAIKSMSLTQDPIENFKKTVNLITAGKLSANKGFDRLMEVHKRLIDEGLKHNILILGIGEDLEKLKKKASELGVSDSFRFLGFQKNPYQYIAHCDLYVCSSFREGFSTAVSEALILGVPVVSTEVSGATELLGENNEYGIVTENSTEGLYLGLKQMLSNPDTLSHYKKQAEMRGSFFSKEKTVTAVENLFDSLLYE